MIRPLRVGKALSFVGLVLLASITRQLPEMVFGSASAVALASSLDNGVQPSPVRTATHTADYDIMVSLATERREATGHMVIRFLNTSNRPLTELYFHL